MLNTKLNKLVLTYLLIFSNLSWANDDKPQEHLKQENLTHNSGNEDNWKSLNAKLIRPARLKAYMQKSTAIKLCSSFGLGTLFGGLFALYIQAITPYDIITTAAGTGIDWGWRIKSKKGVIVSSLISLWITKHSYRWMHEWIAANYEQDQLKIYIQNWEKNKANTPKKLHKLLDDTYSNYKSNPAEVDFAETARIVKAFINNHNKKEIVNQ